MGKFAGELFHRLAELGQPAQLKKSKLVRQGFGDAGDVPPAKVAADVLGGFE